MEYPAVIFSLLSSFWVSFLFVNFIDCILNNGCIIVLGALRAGPNASPPLNMKQSLIFMGVVVVAVSSLVFFIRGEQKRKALDERKLQESLEAAQQGNRKP